MVSGFATLASVASADVIFDVLSHGGPKEGAGDKVKGLGDTEVTCSRGIVTFFQDISLEFRVVRDADKAFMEEKIIMNGVVLLFESFESNFA